MAKFWIIVADSARARIFDAEKGLSDISEIAALIHTEGREQDRDLGSDRPGRSFDSVGGGRHAMSKHVSPHEHEADLFAKRVADHLKTALQSGEFRRLKLAAPPAFLGLLRKHLDDAVTKHLDETVSKNLVEQTPSEIAAYFFGPGHPGRAGAKT